MAFGRGSVMSSNDRVGRPKLCSMFFSHNHEMDPCVANAEGHWLKEEGLRSAEPW